MNQAEKNLKNEISKIVAAYARCDREGFYYVDYEQIPDSDKHRLAALFIEVDDRDLVSIYENQLDMPSLIIKALVSECKEDAQEFAENFKNAIAKYYERRILLLLATEANEIGSCDDDGA